MEPENKIDRLLGSSFIDMIIKDNYVSTYYDVILIVRDH